MSAELPVGCMTHLLRSVFNLEVSVLDGEVSSTAFTPVKMDSTAFTPKAKDKGMLSTEHGDRPGGAAGYLEECPLDDVAGIWAVTVGECEGVELPVIPDGHLPDRSDWHVSIDFTGHLSEGSSNVNKVGKRKARKLRDHAVGRGQCA